MVRDRFLQLNGERFHYREWSTRGAPLVLLHGLASQSHIFDRVAPMLTDEFRVVAFDQRGHGESFKPDDGYDFATVSADLVAFLDALKIKRAISRDTRGAETWHCISEHIFPTGPRARID